MGHWRLWTMQQVSSTRGFTKGVLVLTFLAFVCIFVCANLGHIDISLPLLSSSNMNVFPLIFNAYTIDNKNIFTLNPPLTVYLGASHLRMDMNPHLEDTQARALSQKDAIFFSPHKLAGGINTPGVLVVKKFLLSKEVVPEQSGIVLSPIQAYTLLKNTKKQLPPSPPQPNHPVQEEAPCSS